MRNLGFLRYFVYALLVAVLYVLQATPKMMPEILGSKPLLLLPLALSIASVEDKVPSLIFGAVCGALTDIASGGGVGFFAVLLTLICYFEAHIFSTYFVSNIISASAYAAVSVTVLIGLYFLLFRLISGVPDAHILFVNHYISRIIYTIVMFIPLCAVTRFIHNCFK